MAEHPDETETEQPSYDRWSRKPALSTRGYVLAVVIPVLIAAAGFGVVSLISADTDTVSGTTVHLPVSGWAPSSDTGGDVTIQGTIAVDDQKCVYLTPTRRGGNESDQIWVVWPAGFHAVLDQGRLTIYDADDKPVAGDGDLVQMTGSTTPVSSYATESCLPDSGTVSVVESDVTVLQ